MDAEMRLAESCHRLFPAWRSADLELDCATLDRLDLAGQNIHEIFNLGALPLFFSLYENGASDTRSHLPLLTFPGFCSGNSVMFIPGTCMSR